MKKSFMLLLCLLCVFAFLGCDKKPAKENMSISKYSNITGKNYEETSDGYRAAFYSIEEIDVDKIKKWIDTCQSNGKCYEYIYSDPDSWDMFVYYPVEDNTDKIYKSFKFCKVESTVKIYLENNIVSTEEKPSDYILIRVQAPMRGAWPNDLMLFADDQQISVARDGNN